MTGNISQMTFDYGAIMKNLTLTFWPKRIFKINIHVEKPGKNFGTKSQKHDDNPKCTFGTFSNNILYIYFRSVSEQKKYGS